MDMRKTARIAIGLGLLLLTGMVPGRAAEWPAKPIRLVVPSSAGGAADLIGRTFANAIAPALGQQFVVDNRPGAGGAIATEQIVRAEPDGYTLMVSGLPYQVLGPGMNPNVTFDPVRDFTHIAFFGGPPMVLVAHPTLNVKTFAQLTALAAESKSGIDYVSPGVGTVGHMVAEYIKSRARLHIRHVPYKGGGAALIDVVDGAAARPRRRARAARHLERGAPARLPRPADLCGARLSGGGGERLVLAVRPARPAGADGRAAQRSGQSGDGAGRRRQGA